MSVLISNPERKKDRTDSDANDREIYVAGLARSVTKEDLEKLFATVSDLNVCPIIHLVFPSMVRSRKYEWYWMIEVRPRVSRSLNSNKR